MFNRMLMVIACLVSLSACAHHNAVRVDCEGPLRPINRPPVSSAAPLPLVAPSPELVAPAGEGGHER